MTAEVALSTIMVVRGDRSGDSMEQRRSQQARTPTATPTSSGRRRVRRLAFGVMVALVAGAGTAVIAAVVRDRAPLRPAARSSAMMPGRPPVARRRPPRPPRRVLVVGGRRQPPRVPVPWAASGRYVVVPGRASPPRGGRGTVIRYMVEVERGLPFRGRDFAAAVQRILNDPRGWGSGGRMRFERTDQGPVRIRVSLSSPALSSRRCLPLDTGGQLSCWHPPRAIINALRWGRGAASYGRDLASYREYVISHEVGHGLGHGHVPCPGAGRPAPVMAQQTKSLSGCRRNPWPHRRAAPPRTAR
jgi:hypothetical protein